MGVLLDLDLTLVDSRQAETFRRARRWSEVYKLIPGFGAYEGVSDLISELVEMNVPICVVTSSPRSYCSRVLDHFKWAGVQMVCYHDTRQHKPHPEPILRGLSMIGVRAADAVAVGDDPRDTAAARAAGVYSIGALWGAIDRDALIKSGPDSLCESVSELREVIFRRLRG